MSSRVRRGVIFGIALGAIGVVCRPFSLGLRLEEEVALPLLFALRGPSSAPTSVAVVSIDTTSAEQLGLDRAEWPPPRRIHASLIRALNRLHVSVIVMDTWFEQQRAEQDDDELARAMTEGRNVVLVQRLDRLRAGGATTADSLQSPIVRLQQSARALGPFPLPSTSLTPFFWPFFDTSAGVVPTLPSVALQIHALPVLDRLRAIVDPDGKSRDWPREVISVDDSRQLMRFLRNELTKPAAVWPAIERLRQAERNGLAPKDASLLAALLALYSGPESYYLNFYGPPAPSRPSRFTNCCARAIARRGT